MATTYELKSYAEPAWADINRVIERVSKAEDVTGTKFETINNAFKVFKLPVGAKILGGGIICENLEDTSNNITLSLQVTNGTTTKTLISGDAIGQTGGKVFYPVATTTPEDPADQALGFVTDDQDYYVKILVAAAAAAAAGVTANLQGYIKYTLDTEAGERTN